MSHFVIIYPPTQSKALRESPPLVNQSCYCKSRVTRYYWVLLEEELKRILKEKNKWSWLWSRFLLFCIINYVILYICKSSVINDSEQPPLCKYCSVMYERLCLDMESVKTVSGGNSFLVINGSGIFSFLRFKFSNTVQLKQTMEDCVKPYSYVITEKRRKYSEWKRRKIEFKFIFHTFL